MALDVDVWSCAAQHLDAHCVGCSRCVSSCEERTVAGNRFVVVESTAVAGYSSAVVGCSFVVVECSSAVVESTVAVGCSSVAGCSL